MGDQILNWQAGERPRVLLLVDDESVATTYYEWLAGHVRVDTVRTIDDAVETFDERVFVLAADAGFPAKPLSALGRSVSSHLPWCRILLVCDTGEETDGLAFEAATRLEGDVVRETLVGTVQRHLADSTLDAALHDYYRLNARLAEQSSVRRHDSRSWTEEYEQTRAALAAVKARLPGLKAAVNLDHFAILARASRIGSEYDDVGPAGHRRRTGSKYRPDYCPSCRVDWTGSSLGPGEYVPLGAFVWRCGNCGRIYQARKTRYRRNQ